MYFAAFLTGIFAAMGVGGGMILIVYLTFFAGYSQLEAQGMNLVYFLPIALLSVIIHSRNGLIDWRRMVLPAVCGAAFAVIGALAACFAGSDMLAKIYGGFILLIGFKELFSKGK